MYNQPSYNKPTNTHSPISCSHGIKCDHRLTMAALIPLPKSIAMVQSVSSTWSATATSRPTATVSTSLSILSTTPTLKQTPSYSLSNTTVPRTPRNSTSVGTLTLKHTPSYSLSNITATRPPPTPRNSSINHCTNISNEMIQINPIRHNGIVGVYLSSETVKTASDFWNKNISKLNISDELEIGCSIFYGMVSTDTAIKNLFLWNTNCNNKLEIVSLKFLDMMGYLLRYLLRNDINIYSSLKLLGSLHSKAGVTVNMYDVMLTAMHGTFAHYFSDQYTNEVKNAMDEVFNVVTHIMTDQDDVDDMDIEYLKSVDKCLASLDGKSALFAYLKQCGCKSIVSFHKLLHKFKTASNDMKRFKVARDIVWFNIECKKLDISSKTTQNILVEMQDLNVLWLKNISIAMDITFFDDVEREVNELISKRYWKAFKDNIRVLQETL